MREAFVTLTEYLCLLSPYLSTRRDCHGAWLTWDRRWNGTTNSKVLGIWIISDREIKSYLQYERWFCNFYWIFLTSLLTLLLSQTALVLDWHGTVDDMVPRILRLVGIERKSDIWTKRFLQNERCLCNFDRIFVAFRPTLLLIQTALVLDWHGTVHDMVQRILRVFLGIERKSDI